MEGQIQQLSEPESTELLTLLHELFKGYPIKEITLQDIILENGQTFRWRPHKTPRTEDMALNEPSLIEQFLTIYIQGCHWQSHPLHDAHAGRFRNLDFFPCYLRN